MTSANDIMAFKNVASESVVALISAPWPLYNRPSIQLGALKAFLLRQFPGLQVDAHHLFLHVARGIGYSSYQRICQRTWLAESVYAALLHPSMHDRAGRLFRRQARGDARLRGIDFDCLVRTTGEVSDRWIEEIDGSKWLLAGFSNSLCQLTATLYFIRRLKARWPDLPVVLGGAGMVPAAADALRGAFAEIDVVVSGEGERPLADLVSHFMSGGSVRTLSAGDGANRSPEAACRPRFDQMPDLSDLPMPNFDDYFTLLAAFPSEDRFFPELPVEMSRGCWWRRGDAGRGRSGCRFCNLNLQWEGYRCKTGDRMVAEVDALTRRHRVLSVAFMDNALPPSGVEKAFSRLAGLNKDLSLFAEVRATIGRQPLEALHRAGLREVQVGIEALGGRLLRRFNKGTRVIDNLAIMKRCQELGIENRSNLILEFPGSDEADVAETLRNLDFAAWFRPLRPVSFWLGYGSAVWRRPKEYGLRAVYNHPNYASIFPEGPLLRLSHMIQAYRGDRRRQQALWRPVRRRLKEWKVLYRNLSGNGCGHPLSYGDGVDFILIRQCRSNQAPLNHRLTGMSRRIYLFCAHHRSVKSIVDRFPDVEADRLLAFLKQMVDMRLMFEDNGRYLSLAVRSCQNLC